MYYMIDNYDSFVYNLAAYLEEAGHEVLVRRADEVRLDEIEKADPDGILISPGPKRPADAKESGAVLHAFQGQIPILGVCLGHQVIGQYYGAVVEKGKRPMHGKLSYVRHEAVQLFEGIPQDFLVTRYHSLVIDPDELPSDLKVTARSEDGAIMAVAHTDYPVYGVQYHPEAVLTEYGHRLLENFHRICMEWRKRA